MSQFVRLKTEIRSLPALKAALLDMGFGCEEGRAISGYSGPSRRSVELAVVPPGRRRFEMGFARDRRSGTLDLVHNRWALRRDRAGFLRELKQRVACHQVKEALAVEKLTIESESQEADGTIVFEIPLPVEVTTS